MDNTALGLSCVSDPVNKKKEGEWDRERKNRKIQKSCLENMLTSICFSMLTYVSVYKTLSQYVNVSLIILTAIYFRILTAIYLSMLTSVDHKMLSQIYLSMLTSKYNNIDQSMVTFISVC